jgi:hypothetical protein
MNLIDQIAEQVASLPREAQEEVLDFVGYLVRKYASDAPTEEEAWDEVSDRGASRVGGSAGADR